MQFRELKDMVTEAVCADRILYTDVDGTVWTVPQGHRFWDLYQQWLSQGNTPQPPI